MIIKSQRLIFASIYRPPNNKDFLKHFELIAERLCKRSTILLLGDFNIDLSAIKDTIMSHSLNNILLRYGWTNLIKTPTRITDRSATLIVLAITADKAKVLNNGSYEAGISNHNFIFVSLKLTKNKNIAKAD